MKDKIMFSSEPFDQNTKEVSEFKEGASIYGRVILSKPLKHYYKQPDDYDKEQFIQKGVYNNYLVFYARPVDQPENRRTNHEIKLFLKDSDLDKTTIDFDISPSNKSVSSLYRGSSGFLCELANSSSNYEYFGKKIEYIITLKSANSGDLFFEQTEPETTGSFILDFTDSGYESLAEWITNVESNFSLLYKKFFD